METISIPSEYVTHCQSIWWGRDGTRRLILCWLIAVCAILVHTSNIWWSHIVNVRYSSKSFFADIFCRRDLMNPTPNLEWKQILDPGTPYSLSHLIGFHWPFFFPTSLGGVASVLTIITTKSSPLDCVIISTGLGSPWITNALDYLRSSFLVQFEASFYLSSIEMRWGKIILSCKMILYQYYDIL